MERQRTRVSVQPQLSFNQESQSMNNFDLAGCENWSAKELAAMREDLRREGRILSDVVSTKSVTNEQLDRMKMITDKIDAIDSIYDQRKAMEARIPAPHVPFENGSATKSGGGNYFNHGGSTKSLGEIFTDSTPYRTMSGNRPSFSVDFGPGSIQSALKATLTTSLASPDPSRLPVVSLVGTQPPNVLDFIPMTEIRGGSLDYLREGSFTNSANVVNETVAKPEATLGLSSVAVTPRVVAVQVPVTRQTLQDVAASKDYVNSRLTTMVRMKAEQQVLTGTGAAGPPQQIRGYLSTVGIQTEAKAASPDTNLLAVARAINKVRTVGFTEPDAVIMHPTNFLTIQTSVTAGSGDFVYQSPAIGGPRSVWGVPLILTTGITLNTALVGSFAAHSRVYTVGGLISEVGYVANDFIENLLRFLVEMRLDLAVFRPNAFCSVTALT
jgi:Phage capsid family